MTKLKRFLLVSVAILSAVLISCTSVGEPRVYPEGPVSFTIVETTDIHGMIFPYDFLKCMIGRIYPLLPEWTDFIISTKYSKTL